MATTERTLQLLGLFQARSVWTAAELAAELGVTDRTVRRDVERLRELGYRIGAARGGDGGYRLSRGSVVPPLLLSSDEAVAVALSLRTAGLTGIAGPAEPALRAAVKLEALLPVAARQRLAALGEAIRLPDELGPGGRRNTDVDVDLLATLAEAVARRRQIRADYADRRGNPTQRRLEPHRLSAVYHRWYLAAWDLDRDDWRIFRLDRLGEVRISTFGFSARSDEPNIAERIRTRPPADSYRHQARIRVHAPLSACADLASVGTLTPDGDDTLLITGTDDPAIAAWWFARIERPFTLEGDEAVLHAMQALAARLDRSSHTGRR